MTFSQQRRCGMLLRVYGGCRIEEISAARLCITAGASKSMRAHMYAYRVRLAAVVHDDPTLEGGLLKLSLVRPP